MGNTLDVMVRVLNALGMLGLPVALGFILARRLGTSWSLYGIGAVTFVGSQVLHIPFNAWILGPGLARFGLAGNVAGSWPRQPPRWVCRPVSSRRARGSSCIASGSAVHGRDGRR